eukprot:TRINITY_DN376_c0_g2_i1.p1 TRINITY_DN376_c0_g2~~TRINITY_DN376_c0_g2_i1.p1  ORF type:complete len:269 (+),score=111.13 TRINITY_DN376_c0_g2_i1:169-975(+)
MANKAKTKRRANRLMYGQDETKEVNLRSGGEVLETDFYPWLHNTDKGVDEEAVDSPFSLLDKNGFVQEAGADKDAGVERFNLDDEREDKLIDKLDRNKRKKNRHQKEKDLKKRIKEQQERAWSSGKTFDLNSYDDLHSDSDSDDFASDGIKRGLEDAEDEDWLEEAKIRGTQNKREYQVKTEEKKVEEKKVEEKKVDKKGPVDSGKLAAEMKGKETVAGLMKRMKGEKEKKKEFDEIVEIVFELAKVDSVVYSCKKEELLKRFPPLNQ